MQILPGDHNFESMHPDPDIFGMQLDCSEVDRHVTYFEQLEKIMPSCQQHSLPKLIKECLHNTASERPTSEQLVTRLEGIRVEVEGPYRKLAKVDALRQVMIAKAMRKDLNDDYKTKDQKIHQFEVSVQLIAESNMYPRSII